MKNILLALVCLLPILGIAQSRKCATMEHMYKELLNNPTLKENRQQIEQYTQNYAANYQNGKSSVVHTIPVVVHIVLPDPTVVTDAQVFSQIDVLNEDFRKTNSDTNLVPTPFKGSAADSEIEFCLASVDPFGNPTTGITRTITAMPSFDPDYDSVKYTSKGGIDAWNTSNYLNIWVCNVSGGVLGYAQFPGGGPASTDGVVILYTAFGTSGTATAPYNLGRTATHEVGHYLNLYHIWGDEPACDNDDLVSDTPLQGPQNYGCPTFPHTDACQSTSPGVMFMNYMDYVDDNCMHMFTAGQKTRMKAALTGPRVSLTTSGVCTPTSILSSNIPTPYAVKVYPNPSHDIINISTDNILKNVTLTLYDYTGKKHYSQTYTQLSTLQLSMADYPKGIYHLQLIADNKLYSQKIVIE